MADQLDGLTEEQAMSVARSQGARAAYLHRATLGHMLIIDLLKLACAMSTALDESASATRKQISDEAEAMHARVLR